MWLTIPHKTSEKVELQMNNVKKILLPNWQIFDGSGVYDQPARNVKLKDSGKNACIIIGTDGLSVHKNYLHIFEQTEDEGAQFIAYAKPKQFAQLKEILTDAVISEAEHMFTLYMRQQARFVF
jgi:hypothetical protein